MGPQQNDLPAKTWNPNSKQMDNLQLMRNCQFDLVECITDDFILRNWICEACKAFGKDEEASARAADDDILDACLPVSRTKCS